MLTYHIWLDIFSNILVNSCMVYCQRYYKPKKSLKQARTRKSLAPFSLNMYGISGMKISPIRFCAVLISMALTSSCAFVRAPSVDELALLDNPPDDVRRIQEQYTPLVMHWFQNVEESFVNKGRSLSEAEISMARALGVKSPNQVRVVVLAQFPLPQNETLRAKAISYGVGSLEEGGRTMGYIIMLKEKYAQERWILAHELTHVAQQEQMGREAFVRRLIAERELMGYRRAPLELDANKRALEFM